MEDEGITEEFKTPTFRDKLYAAIFLHRYWLLTFLLLVLLVVALFAALMYFFAFADSKYYGYYALPFAIFTSFVSLFGWGVLGALALAAAKPSMLWLAFLEGFIAWMLLNLAHNATGKRVFWHKKGEKKPKVELVLKDTELPKAGEQAKPEQKGAIKFFD